MIAHVAAMTPTHHSPLPDPTLTLSRALAQAVAQGAGPHISIQDLISGIKAQALALMLILFALPNILPSLPGTSAITGLPLMLLTLQLTLGQGVWLPRLIADRAVPRAGFQALLNRAQPYFDWVEARLRPRLLWASSPWALRGIGAVMLTLSLVIMLPIPFANALPALSILILAIGIAVRDGVFILAGLVAAVGTATLISALYGTMVVLALTKLTPFF